MRKTRYVHGQDFSWLIDVNNLQNVSELANPKCFNGSKPPPWVPSVLRVIFICAIMLVLSIWWIIMNIGWYFQFWRKVGWELLLDAYQTLPMPLNLVPISYLILSSLIYLLIPMGGGLALVVCFGGCVNAWLISIH